MYDRLLAQLHTLVTSSKIGLKKDIKAIEQEHYKHYGAVLEDDDHYRQI